MPMSGSCGAFSRSCSRRPGSMYGLTPTRSGISKPPGRTKGGASSTAIIRDGARSGTNPNTTKMLIFARVLPLIRARVDANLRRHSLPREQVLAAVVRLLELTLLRVGNDGYAKANKSFGLTTLRDRHAEITGSHIHLRFRGKGGARYETDINDPRVRASSNLAETFPATSYSNISTMPASAIPSVRQRSTPISARSPAKT